MRQAPGDLVPTTCRTARREPKADEDAEHGGADPLLIEQPPFRTGRRTHRHLTVAARMAMAAGFRSRQSLRHGGTPREVPALDPERAACFERGQVRGEA